MADVIDWYVSVRFFDVNDDDDGTTTSTGPDNVSIKLHNNIKHTFN